MADQSLRRSWLFHAFSSLLTSLGSEFLPRRPEQDFVDINIVRLAYGEGDRAREGIGRNSEFIIKLAENSRRGPPSDFRLRLGRSVAVAPGDITVVRIL